jgi:hypothetical protein
MTKTKKNQDYGEVSLYVVKILYCASFEYELDKNIEKKDPPQNKT